jgi:hypothetical protein
MVIMASRILFGVSFDLIHLRCSKFLLYSLDTDRLVKTSRDRYAGKLILCLTLTMGMVTLYDLIIPP